MRVVVAWLVHLLTASGAVIGLYALWTIQQQDYHLALWLMALTIFIDAIDGTLARIVNVQKYTPQINGHLLDNIVDYFTFVIVPAYFIISSQLVLDDYRFWAAGAMAIASCYQFSHVDAKTSDHYFKGFPSYWNILVFYLMLLGLTPMINLVVIGVFVIMVFVPIKYIYPSRLDYFSQKAWQRNLLLVLTGLWAIVNFLLLWNYPEVNSYLLWISMGYVIIYFALSLERTINT